MKTEISHMNRVIMTRWATQAAYEIAHDGEPLWMARKAWLDAFDAEAERLAARDIWAEKVDRELDRLAPGGNGNAET